MEVAGRLLGLRDLSRGALETRLRSSGVAADAAAAVAETLEAVGAVDDDRLARSRARRLADRGFGDAAVDARLGALGIAREARERAVRLLEPEEERARRIAASANMSRERLGARLSRRGFGTDAVEAALTYLDGPEASRLG